METAVSLSPEVGIRPACESLGVSRATFYRKRKKEQAPTVVTKERRRHPRALSPEEWQEVLDILHSDRFVDKAPHEVYATLPEEYITARYAPCTASLMKMQRSESAEISSAIPSIRSRNCWPQLQTRFGHGISPSC